MFLCSLSVREERLVDVRNSLANQSSPNSDLPFQWETWEYGSWNFSLIRCRIMEENTQNLEDTLHFLSTYLNTHVCLTQCYFLFCRFFYLVLKFPSLPPFLRPFFLSFFPPFLPSITDDIIWMMEWFMNHLLLKLLAIYRFWKAEAWYLVFCSLLNQWTILTPVDNFRPAIIQKATDKLIGVENNTK